MIILNEKEYAEKIIRTGEVGTKPSSTINLLARYMFHCCGIEDKEVLENEINEFMNRNCNSFNAVKWSNMVEYAIKNAHKYPIKTIDGINIYQSELDVINELEDIKDRKLLFSYMCYAKYYNAIRPDKNNNWANVEPIEIYKVARVTVRTSRDRMMKLSKMKCFLNNEDGSNPSNPNCEVRFTKARKVDSSNMQIPFIVQEPISEEPVLVINDFRELGYEYLMYYGIENFGRCQHEDCGLLFKQNKNGDKKFCNEHKGYQTIGEIKKVCDCCGKEFITSAQNTTQKRCYDCGEEHTYYEKKEVKIIKCIDCSKVFEVEGIVKKQERCSECAKKRRKEKERIRQKNLREKAKI